MLSALSGAGVDYLIVGAYALAAHGLPRATLTEHDLVTPGTMFQIGVEPQRIDILTSIEGVEFDDAWSARYVTRLGGRGLRATPAG